MTTDQEHVGFCIQTLKQAPQFVQVDGTPNFDFGSALESVYPLLDLVFSYLSYRELQAVAKVKKSWQDIVERVLLSRNSPSWVTCFRVAEYLNDIRASDSLNYNNIGLGIILYNTRRLKLNKYVCVHTNVSQLSIKTVVEYIADEFVPENIQYCLLSCPKVVSYFPIKPARKSVQDSTFDGLFLPVIPNIRTAMFHCNPVKIKELKEQIKSHKKDNEEVKCLLMFYKNDVGKSIYVLLDELLQDLKPSSVAVGGGIIKGTKTFQEVNKQKKVSQNDMFCISFNKNKDEKCEFDAYSVVISGDDLSTEEFEEELNKFKSKVTLRKQSAAFRICCSAKMDTEIEVVLFAKVFPGVPLLGMEADGEIGWNCYNDLDLDSLGEIQSKRVKRQYPTVQHQWSTIIVLLTWGKIVQD